MTLREIVSTFATCDILTETLSCGHDVEHTPDTYAPAARRRCKICTDLEAEWQDFYRRNYA